MRVMKINRSIFSDEAIGETLRAYSEILDASVLFESDYAVVSFRECLYDENLTAQELENYMIGIESSLA